MTSYEYVVVPAPRKATKVKGAKTPEARFAHALTDLMNTYGAEGWEYLRSDTLPSEERSGLTGTKTVFQNMLVFRRELAEQYAAPDDFVMPAKDTAQTPEALAAELESAQRAPAAQPAPATARPHDPSATPRLGGALDAGQAPPIGPATSEDSSTHVHRSPLTASDRPEGRKPD